MPAQRYLTALLPATALSTTALWTLTRQSWAYFGVEAMASKVPGPVSFADLANITATADCLRMDVALEQCDPYGRPFQPYVVAPARILSWLHLGLSNTPVLGIALTTLLIVTVTVISLWIASQWRAASLSLVGAQLVFAAACISPPILLGIERGQLEIVTFALTVLALLLLASRRLSMRWIGGAVGVLAVLTKFFPIGLWAPFVRRGRPHWPALVGLAASIGATIILWSVLVQSGSTAGANQPATSKSQFGSANLVATALSSDPIGYSPDPWVIAHWTTVKAAGWSIFLVMTVVTWWLIRSRRSPADLPDGNTQVLLLGCTGVLVVPYLLGTSHDYRELFLLPVLASGLVMLKSTQTRVLGVITSVGSFVALITGAAMVSGFGGFLWNKAGMLTGDLGLLTVLSLATAIWLLGLEKSQGLQR